MQSVLKETTAVIANSSSIYGKPMANYVLAQMLRWNKRIDHHIELQKEKDWKPHGGDGELTIRIFYIRLWRNWKRNRKNC